MSGCDEATKALIATTLSAAVPLYIEEMKAWPWERVREQAEKSAQIVAEKGDVILFRSKKKGETAAAFNALARGVAALSFAVGGVTLFGLHFEAKHEGPS